MTVGCGATGQYLCEPGDVDGAEVDRLAVEDNELEVLSVVLASTHSPLSEGLGAWDLRTNASPAHNRAGLYTYLYTCNYTVQRCVVYMRQ